MEKIYIVGTTLLLLKLIIKNGYGSFWLHGWIDNSVPRY